MKNFLIPKKVASLSCYPLVLCLVFACKTSEKTKKIFVLEPTAAPQFRQIEAAQSGIDFNNAITPNIATKENLFDFDFFYNGAGVGIADINNDGLPDIFFCGNQVENKLYLNKGDLEFEDISANAGINVGKAWSNGVTFADVNGDDWLDIYVSQGGPFEKEQRANLLFINQKNNTFREAAAKYGLADQGISTQTAFFDFDQDGDLDAIVANENELYGVDPVTFFRLMGERPELRWQSSSHLYRNDNDKYTDITKAAGLLNPTFGLGLSVSDINDDGWLDIYIANDYYVPDNLYINQHNGTFRDESKLRMNQMSFYGMGVDVADMNNDGKQDIYVLDMASNDHYRAKTLMASMSIKNFDLLVNGLDLPHQYMFNSLQVNKGDGNYQNVAHFSEIAKTDWSWAGLLADWNNDGWKDIYVTNGYRKYGLDNDLKNKINQAKATYKGNVPIEVKQKLYDAMPSEALANLFYLNQSNLNFKDETAATGMNQVSFSNGAAYADLDLDGDLDLVVNNIDEAAFLYQNLSSETQSANYLRVQLEGVLSETFAKVTIKYAGQQQLVESKRVKGYYSATENVAHFGVGKARLIDTVRVEWGSGLVEERYQVKSNQVLIFKKLDALQLQTEETAVSSLFQKVSLGALKLMYRHQENDYDDFAKEVLLPYKQSTLGPCLTKGDVNGDGLDDIFVGGAAGQAATLFLQTKRGFEKQEVYAFLRDKAHEDVNAHFFDADQDGDQDLFVVSGDNAFIASDLRYANRLYWNDGKGGFMESKLPFSAYSGKAVASIDFDQDGDLDLIEGNRIMPQQYPQSAPSFLYENASGKFIDVTTEIAPELKDFGIINAILPTDFNQDGHTDFIALGEWTSVGLFINENGKYKNITAENEALNAMKGWYFSAHEMDVNKDGKPDYLIGNLGLNTKFSASPKKPFKVFANDFDENGSYDIVLSKQYKDEYVPVRGRECSSQQMPFIEAKFQTYDAFAKATMADIYGDEKLDNSLALEATDFRSFVLINKGNNDFEINYLPAEAQQFPLLDAVVMDVNKDGYEDAIVIGNIYNTEVETPRWDTGSGLVLYGNQSGQLKVDRSQKDDLNISGNAKTLIEIKHLGRGKNYLIAGRNNDLLVVFEVR
ncbi:MAG: VCBS repeat-containing protein [Bacteroidota bacterium]